MDEIIYQHHLEDIDWGALKETLADDHFDNGRTPRQLEVSFRNSHSYCFARLAGGRIVGKARVLSDGVSNAYVVDVWTHSHFRRRGVARHMVESLLARLHGQHVYLFTDDQVEFYKRIGFVERPTGMERVIGRWLVNDAP